MALVEVKGFEKGASPKGATQLASRPLVAFVTAEGRAPDALWYVSNHDLATDPDERPVGLAGDSAIDLLEGHGGAFIDTRDLLRAHLDVLAGVLDPADARALLVSARGRFAYRRAVSS